MPFSSPDALDADLLRVGIKTLRLAGDACECDPVTTGLCELITIIITMISNTH